jgi:imidazoleglycerol-phosphate dehydratase
MKKSANAGRRAAALRRETRETRILVALDLDPALPSASIGTGIGFLDHMLTSLAIHAGWELRLACRGDLEVDEHHSAEDCALALGEAFARALARGPKPRRFGSAHAPLDEALARAVVDLSGRAYCRADTGLAGTRLGELEGENVDHFLLSFAQAARMTLHVDVLAGANAHHKAEAAFKALALALREATAIAPAAARVAEGADAVSSSSTIANAQGASSKGSVLLEEIDGADWAELEEGLE